MRLLTTATLIAAAFILVATPAQAANIGDPAADLNIAEWIKGEPVDMVKGDTTYVVEFWATWCGPCLQTIPHLTEVQEKYKDQNVVVIGVSDEDAATVKPFVAKQGDNMNYRVVVDSNRETYAGYMQAYGRNGIPAAFIVDKNLNVAWVGHPLDGMDAVLEKVVEGTFDPVVHAEQMATRELQVALVNGMINAAQEGDAGAVNGAAKEALAKYPGEKDLLGAVAWLLLDHPNEEIRNPELSLEIIRAALKVQGDRDPMVIDTYARALYETGDAAQAVIQQQKAVDLAPNDEIRAKLQQTLARYEAGD
jgi:thiol-disulfide isomerase/thioredoxin